MLPSLVTPHQTFLPRSIPGDAFPWPSTSPLRTPTSFAHSKKTLPGFKATLPPAGPGRPRGSGHRSSSSPARDLRRILRGCAPPVALRPGQLTGCRGRIPAGPHACGSACNTQMRFRDERPLAPVHVTSRRHRHASAHPKLCTPGGKLPSNSSPDDFAVSPGQTDQIADITESSATGEAPGFPCGTSGTCCRHGSTSTAL